MSLTAEFLDQMIPLDGASHADAVDYSTVIPLRYAECVAKLADGRQVRLRDPRQLVGWSGTTGQRTFLFRNGDRGIEIRINAARHRKIREVHECSLRVAESLESEAERIRKLVSCDGSLVFAWQTGRARVASAVGRLRPLGNGIDAESGQIAGLSA